MVLLGDLWNIALFKSDIVLFKLTDLFYMHHYDYSIDKRNGTNELNWNKCNETNVKLDNVPRD